VRTRLQCHGATGQEATLALSCSLLVNYYSKLCGNVSWHYDGAWSREKVAYHDDCDHLYIELKMIVRTARAISEKLNIIYCVWLDFHLDYYLLIVKIDRLVF
jgi:hypothetical protein